MDLRTEFDRYFSNVLLSDLAYYRDMSDLDLQSLKYMELIRYTDRRTVSGLAEVLGVDKSTVSRKVDSMVDSGLIARERDPSDGRVQMLRLSHSQEKLYDMYDEPYDRAMDRIVRELSPDGLEAVCKAVRILTEEIEREHGLRT